MSHIPLLSHSSLRAPLAFRGGAAISAAQFAADVAHLAEHLPAGANILNVCSDRYRFAVGFGASLLTGKVSLLPSTHTPEVIRQLRTFAPGVFCLSDDPRCGIDLPITRFPDLPAAHGNETIQSVSGEQLAAYVFTSGSTGLPVPHPKTWGRLSSCVRDGARRLGLSDGLGSSDGKSYTIIGTVPPQHMYGFESTVLMALQGGMAFCAEHPFYPADIAATLDSVQRPRILVSTPIHLRALLAATTPIPALDLVLSATAPLDRALAAEVEQRMHVRLMEIYGSTETGQIATRCTSSERAWTLWPGVELEVRDGQALARGGHIEHPTVLGDVIESVDARHFLLHGRSSDMVNIAGKRSSFAYLDSQLQAIPGVLDGAFFMREAPAARVAALVVAPGLTAAHLVARLRERIDPVFLPRPLILVERLPRNATGKLPREALQAAVARHLAARDLGARQLPAHQPAEARDATAKVRAPLSISATHPAFAGHFPHRPIVPGVVLLDEALAAVGAARCMEHARGELAAAKFHSPVSPGEALWLEHERLDGGSIRLTVSAGARLVASAVWKPR